MHDLPIFETADFTVWLFDPSHHAPTTYSHTGHCAWGGWPHTWCYDGGLAFYSVEGIYGTTDKRAAYAVCRGHLGPWIQNALAVRRLSDAMVTG